MHPHPFLIFVSSFHACSKMVDCIVHRCAEEIMFCHDGLLCNYFKRQAANQCLISYCFYCSLPLHLLYYLAWNYFEFHTQKCNLTTVGRQKFQDWTTWKQCRSIVSIGYSRVFFFCFLCCLCWSLLKSRQTHEGLYLLPSLGIPWSFSCLHVHIVRSNLLHEVRRTLITARGPTAKQSQERMTSWRLGANDYWNKFEQKSNWQSVPIALVNLEWINYRTIFYFKEYCPHFSGIFKNRLLAYDERGWLYCTFLNKY